MRSVLVKDQAAADAREVLANYWADEYPVDVNAVAAAMGLSVVDIILPADTSGMLQVSPDTNPRIYVDSNDVEQRQRFTVAHELGHFVERMTQAKDGEAAAFNFIDKRGGEYDLHEFYADEFAGNLLMPADEVFRVVELSGRVLPVTLARHFDVSLPAVRMRLLRLGLR